MGLALNVGAYFQSFRKLEGSYVLLWKAKCPEYIFLYWRRGKMKPRCLFLKNIAFQTVKNFVRNLVYTTFSDRSIKSHLFH